MSDDIKADDIPDAALDSANDVTGQANSNDASQVVPGASSETVHDVAAFATRVAEEVSSRVASLLSAATEPIGETAERTLETVETAGDTSPGGKPWFS
jgi:hypothetical protein